VRVEEFENKYPQSSPNLRSEKNLESFEESVDVSKMLSDNFYNERMKEVIRTLERRKGVLT